METKHANFGKSKYSLHVFWKSSEKMFSKTTGEIYTEAKFFSDFERNYWLRKGVEITKDVSLFDLLGMVFLKYKDRISRAVFYDNHQKEERYQMLIEWRNGSVVLMRRKGATVSPDDYDMIFNNWLEKCRKIKFQTI